MIAIAAGQSIATRDPFKVNHINLGSCHCPAGEQYHFAFPLNKRRHFRFCFCFWAMTTIANAPQGISIREACKARAKGKQ